MLSRKLSPVIKTVRYLTQQSTVDEIEVRLFNKLSSEWWNKTGALKPLHSFNKLRIPFIRDGLIQNGLVNEEYINTSKALAGLKILDVGCGGGVLSEPLARLGAQVTGLDADTDAVKEAKDHAENKNIKNVSYIVSSIEDHALENTENYHAVVASELVEHVTHKEDLILNCVKCLKPGGSIFITTMSKTLLANILGIQAAECIGIVPKGAHEIDKFIQPHDLQRILEKNKCYTKLVHGMMYVFLTDTWSWTSNTSINYGVHAVKSI